MNGKIDLVGHRFGRIVVIADSGRRNYKSIVWECLCDCGTKTLVIGGNLRRGRTHSCGCWHKEIISDRQLKHGHTSERLQGGMRYSPEYSIWLSMKARCSNPKSTSYALYGGRGITVCQRWSESFGAFISDMGNRPSDDHSIDRKDNNRGYDPSNCRWATDAEQRYNKRNTITVLCDDGSSVTLKHLAETRGIKYATMFRAYKEGRDVWTFTPRKRGRLADTRTALTQ